MTGRNNGGRSKPSWEKTVFHGSSVTFTGVYFARPLLGDFLPGPGCRCSVSRDGGHRDRAEVDQEAAQTRPQHIIWRQTDDGRCTEQNLKIANGTAAATPMR